MREMADRPGNVIVLLIVEYDRNRFQGADKIPERGYLFLRNFCRRREDIVGIFDQVGFGAGESALSDPAIGCPPMKLSSMPSEITSLWMEVFTLPTSVRIQPLSIRSLS